MQAIEWGQNSGRQMKRATVRASKRANNHANSPWKRIGDRQRDRDLKREAVLKTAVALFLEQGYDRASLSDVAAALNITKPALYRYFSGKDAILLECYRLGIEMANTAIRETEEKANTGFERAYAFVRAYSKIMTQDFGMCLVRVDYRVLAKPDQAKIAADRRRIDKALRSFIVRGIADGSVRSCDPKITSLAMFGAMHWIGEWYQQEGPLSPAALGDRFAETLMAGLGSNIS